MTCLQELHQRGDDSLSLEQLSTFCTVSCQIPQSPGTLILQTELMYRYMKSNWCPKKYWHNICLFYNKQDTGSNSVLFVDISYRVFTIVIPYWTQRINIHVKSWEVVFADLKISFLFFRIQRIIKLYKIITKHGWLHFYISLAK